MTTMTLKLQPETVRRVYSGKPGCGCGCLGNYYEDEKNIRRVLKWMARVVVDEPETVKRVGMDDGVAYVETDTRYLWAYLKS